MKLNFGTKLSYGIGAICDNALYMLAGTYLLTQIIIGGIMISIALKLVVKISSDSSAVLLAEDMAGIMRSIYQPLFPAMILAYLVLGIAGYLAAGIIMKRKVNLD